MNATQDSIIAIKNAAYDALANGKGCGPQVIELNSIIENGNEHQVKFASAALAAVARKLYKMMD